MGQFCPNIFPTFHSNFWREEEKTCGPHRFSLSLPLSTKQWKMSFFTLFISLFSPQPNIPSRKRWVWLNWVWVWYGWWVWSFGSFGFCVFSLSLSLSLSLYCDAMILTNDRLIWVLIEVDLGWSGFIYLFKYGFCSDGILVGMVKAQWWWLGSGGVVLKVEEACELVRATDTSSDKLLIRNWEWMRTREKHKERKERKKYNG